MEHKIVLGGFEYLPFARSRVAMLKKLGLPYADQSFEINGVSIKVRIEPGHEYISITGGDKYDYLVWPTSREHYVGIDPEQSLVALTSASVKVKEKVTKLTGKDDWIGKNGEVITYDNGALMRYEPRGGIYLTGGERGLYQDGSKIETEFKVVGAASINRRKVYASLLWSVDEEYTSIGYTSMSLHYADGLGVDPEFARFTVPNPIPIVGNPGQIIAQPVFFSGDGMTLVTVLETAYKTYIGVTPFYSYMPPYYLVTGALSRDESGVITVTFTTTLIPTPPDFDGNSTVITGAAGPVEDGYVDKTTVLGPVNSPRPSGFSGNWPTFSSYTTTGLNSWGKVVSRIQKTRVIGVDITLNGEVKIVKSRELSGSTRTETASYNGGQSSTGLQEWSAEGYIIRIEDTTTGDTTYTHSSSGTGTITQEILINDIVLFTQDTDVQTSSSEEVKTTSYYFYGNSYNPDAFPPGEAPTSVWGPAVTSSSRVVNSTIIGRKQAMSIRELDARVDGIALVLRDAPYTHLQTVTGLVETSRTDTETIYIRLYVKIMGDVHEKTIFTYVGSTYIPVGSMYDHYYRVFASRRKNEYLVCLSPTDTYHESNRPTNGTEYLNFLATIATVDRSPLMVARKGARIFNVDPAKFLLGAESFLRIDPIYPV